MRNNKGVLRPILNEELRLKMVDLLKPVDFCFIDRAPADGHPLAVLDHVFRDLKPEVYAVNADAFGIPYREARAREAGVRLVVLERWCPPEFDGVSTTKIIERILADRSREE